ncbi:MAG: 6-phosphofructokinase [Phycisphaeraceae bacterium]|nr:6-phosphofructokinase [Phycisphaeraceae bacterium]
MTPPSGIRRIGVLTGGGDCPGLNAVLRAVTKTAIFQHGIEVHGIEDGLLGLVEDRVRRLTASDVSGILTRGGTILGSNNRCNPKRHPVGKDAQGEVLFGDVTDRCVATVRAHGLDAVIVIGGDGTMSAAKHLVESGINVIGVPKTIDNDLVGTEITFGFLTAVDTATQALDRLHTTADSHHRVMVCEVMGRNAGWIALTSGVASGSDVILMPEIPFSFDAIVSEIDRRMTNGPGFAIVVVAEGARAAGGEQIVAMIDTLSPDPVRLGGIGAFVAREIQARIGVETRTTVLGHVQRGGTPIPADRVLGTHFGFMAIEALMSGKHGRMIARQGNVFCDVDLLVSANKQRLVPLDHPLVAAARALGTNFGDATRRTDSSTQPAVVV